MTIVRYSQASLLGDDDAVIRFCVCAGGIGDDQERVRGGKGVAEVSPIGLHDIGGELSLVGLVPAEACTAGATGALIWQRKPVGLLIP